MGNRYRISRGTGFGDAGVARPVAGMVAWKCSALAGCGGSWRGCGRLPGRVVELSARSVWGISSELFVLRSEFVFVYAATGLYGADVSAPGSTADNSVWMLARVAICVAGVGGGS